MSQGLRTRNFLAQPHNTLRAPREASPAFRIGEHYHNNPDRWVGYGLAFVAGSLITLGVLGMLSVPT